MLSEKHQCTREKAFSELEQSILIKAADHQSSILAPLRTAWAQVSAQCLAKVADLAADDLAAGDLAEVAALEKKAKAFVD